MKQSFVNTMSIVFSYLGFGPLLLIFSKEENEQFSIRQSIVLWGLLGIIALLMIIVGVAYSLIVVKYPDLYQKYELEAWFISISRKILLGWLIFWLFGFTWSLLRLNRALPLVSRIIVGRVSFAFMYFSNCAMLIFIVLIFCIWFWSYTLLRAPSAGPTTQVKVYILYDDLDYLPRWIFEIGFFPIIRTSVSTYGKGSVVLSVINKKNLSEALKYATILLFATHGTEDGILSRDGVIKPSDIKNMERSNGLRYIYLSGCKGGVQKELWKEAFSPAEVIAYSRMTATFEHILWFWFKAPRLIRDGNISFIK